MCGPRSVGRPSSGGACGIALKLQLSAPSAIRLLADARCSAEGADWADCTHANEAVFVAVLAPRVRSTGLWQRPHGSLDGAPWRQLGSGFAADAGPAAPPPIVNVDGQPAGDGTTEPE